jgi:nucleoside-diphosphate-sugar epimerase
MESLRFETMPSRPHFACEDGRAIALDVLVEPDAGAGLGYDRCERGLADLNGELAVQAAFTDAILVRPAVMFGPDDAFLTTVITLLRRLPIYPMFGRGLTRLQPADVEDVAEAIARALQSHPPPPFHNGAGQTDRQLSLRRAYRP